jgi:hypothetical protein
MMHSNMNVKIFHCGFCRVQNSMCLVKAVWLILLSLFSY